MSEGAHPPGKIVEANKPNKMGCQGSRDRERLCCYPGNVQIDPVQIDSSQLSLSDMNKWVTDYIKNLPSPISNSLKESSCSRSTEVSPLLIVNPEGFCPANNAHWLLFSFNWDALRTYLDWEDCILEYHVFKCILHLDEISPIAG